MSPLDFRVSMTPILNVFGVSATVTRPSPDDTPVSTTGVWVTPGLNETDPIGADFQRRDPRRVIAFERTADLPNAPVGTVILAPEQSGGEVLSWTVDGIDGVFEVDLMRLIVRRTRTP